MLAPPPIEFVVRDGLHLAYQSAGCGPPSIVFVGGSMAMSVQWEEPATAKGLRRLASFARLVTYDQQGMGYSDRMDLSSPPTLDDLCRDLEAVIEAAGVTDPVLFGTHNGGAVAAVYAARHPVRQLDPVQHMGPPGGGGRLPHRLQRPRPRPHGGALPRPSGARAGSPTMYASRRATQPRAVRAGLDQPQPARPSLPHEPHVRHPRRPPVHLGADARHPPGGQPDDPGRPRRVHRRSDPGRPTRARPGTDQLFLRNYGGPVIDEVEQFVTGHVTRFADRMRTTMLFTDIVDSTPLAASLGDEAWSALIDEHNDRVHRQVVAHGGHEVKSTGDGFLVAFDETEAAIRCALVRHGGRGGPRAGAPRRCPRRRGVPHGQERPVRAGRALRPAALAPGRGRPAARRRPPCARPARARASSSRSGARRRSRGSRASGRSSRPACSAGGQLGELTCD